MEEKTVFLEKVKDSGSMYLVTNVNFIDVFKTYSDALFCFQCQCTRKITPIETLREIDKLLTLIRYVSEDMDEDIKQDTLTDEIKNLHLTDKKNLKTRLSKVANVDLDDLEYL